MPMKITTNFTDAGHFFGFGGITVPPVNGSEAVAFVSMPLKSIRVVADLAFLHNEQIMHCQMF